MMSRMQSIGLIVLLLLSVACVTINVYFPAAAAESAAKTIVRDVLGAHEINREEATPAEHDKGSLLKSYGYFGAMSLARLMTLWVSPAYAEADMEIDTPAIRRLRASLKNRYSQLQPYYKVGAVGLTQKGLVAIRKLAIVPLKERNRLKKLVADENNNRNALYKEIARANGRPDWEADIRKTFARVWIDEATSNIWYQDSGGRWKQK